MDGKPADIDEYLSDVPEEARATLASLRRTIREAAPEAEESISYGSPTFKYRGRPLIYFAAAKNHCAIYGIDVEAHREELAAYDAAKGTVRFKPSNPLPDALVKTLVRERMAQIDAAASTGKKRPNTT